MKGLHAVDYVIFVAMLLITMAIAIFHACSGGRQRTTSEYFMGDRNLNVFPVSISLTASFFSSILILGFPAEAYTNGGMYWLYAVGIAVGAIMSCLIFVPVFHPLKLTSVNDYLRQRYHSGFVATLGTISVVISMILLAAIVYFAPATAFQALTGFPTYGTILIGSTITIVYTSIGGIKAVIWTDVFQALLMLAGLLTISIQAILKVGDIAEVWRICEKWDRLNIIDLNHDPTVRLTFWSLVVGIGFLEINRYGCQQMAVQRYCSLPTLTKARLCVLGLVPLITFMTFLATLSGLTMFAYYTQLGCDPLRGGILRNPNQLIPYFVAETLNYPGIQGILLASICAASLSTASSSLNSSSANVWKDIIARIWPNLSERRNVLMTKLLVVVFGIISTGLSFAFVNVGGTLIQMVITFYSSCAGPTTAMFLLGIFFPFTNWIGASSGGVVGFAFGLWMGFGSYTINIQRNFLPTTVDNCTAYKAARFMKTAMTAAMPTTLATTPAILTSTAAMETEVNPLHMLYSVSYLWIACFSMIIAFVIGFIVSLISGRMGGEKVPSKLLHPWVRCCYQAEDDNEDEDEDFVVDSTVKPNKKGRGETNDHIQFDGYDSINVTKM